MNKQEVLNLANLARIRLTDAEAEKLSGEFQSILGYVGEVKEISKTDSRQPTADHFPVKNVMRKDGEGHESGIHTEKLLKEAPMSANGYLKVKKIL